MNFRFFLFLRNIKLIITDYILIILAFLTVYNYLFYPLLLAFFKVIFNNPIHIDKSFEPEITIIIAAYNEEELIEEAVYSILNSDYNISKINILIGSDGSTDKTNEILKSLSLIYKNLKYVEFERSGKNKVLNNLISIVKTDYILFMDADCRMNKNTIKNLMINFSDPSVGSVLASPTVVGDGTTDNAGSEGDSLYHRYEEHIRICEGIIHSNVNSLGYLYVIKTKLFKKIANDFVCDDLYNIYSVLESGKRVYFVRNAPAYEVRKKSLSNELHRRVRAVAGGMATVSYYSNLLNFSKYGWVAFFIISHKIFRWLSSVTMLLLIIATLFINSGTFVWKLFFYGQIIFYGIAFIGWLTEKLGIKIKYARIFLFFVLMNISSILGLFRFINKNQNAIWDRKGFNQ
jgi:cellulose synthase/poly-beta-1,6-N-acetylglucosamine synthase-like glycosyltransferase